MQDFTTQRDSHTADEIWLCEHPPVFTQGLAGLASHVLGTTTAPLVATNRGGQVTFHGPGQVVAYALIDLRRAGYFVKEYVYKLEEAIVRTLLHFGVTGLRVGGAPGVFVRTAGLSEHAMLALSATATRLSFGQTHARLFWLSQNSGAWREGQPSLRLPWRGVECAYGLITF
jgi:lipoyl(octanoyl) transferase